MSDHDNADAWMAVSMAHDRMRSQDLRGLFDADAGRFAAFSRSDCELVVDFSKQRIDGAALDALLDLARASGIAAERDRMVEGQTVNVTEQRAVRHMALRAPKSARRYRDVASAVHQSLDQVCALAEDVRSGRALGHTGERLTDIIHIGIGGSDLGPVLVDQALAPYRNGPRLHFVSNVDGSHLADTIRDVDPARTLVLVASKSFKTLETLMNAESARRWLSGALGEAAVATHFAAITSNPAEVAKFGIDASRTFSFWDWVGGRFSLWSAIGLPIAIGHGPDIFRALLSGAHAMDNHFLDAPLADNLPVLMALVGIWNRNFEGHVSQAVVPYDQRLARLPAYLQQLEMESNGKRVRSDGSPVRHDTAPVIFGEPGTNAQHAFFQMLHQGTTVVPCDFLIAANAHEADPDARTHHAALLANCIGQSAALLWGEDLEAARSRLRVAGKSADDADRLAPHVTFAGNRPSTTILYPKLTPSILGRLIALYEHKVFVQGVIWGINSFDQWGVELGKHRARQMASGLDGSVDLGQFDVSTAGLIDAARQMRKR